MKPNKGNNNKKNAIGLISLILWAMVLTMLFRLTPTLIEQGMVYIAETPLYEIQTKSETYFAYSDREKTESME